MKNGASMCNENINSILYKQASAQPTTYGIFRMMFIFAGKLFVRVKNVYDIFEAFECRFSFSWFVGR